jgi:hypothetical protein
MPASGSASIARDFTPAAAPKGRAGRSSREGDAMRGLAALAVAAALAGCASQLTYDLGKAEDSCHDQKFPTKSALVACLTAQERPVWAKDEPQTLDLYDQYATARAALAQQRDAGTLSEDQYEKQLGDTNSDFRARISARRAAEPPAATPAPPAVAPALPVQ